MTFPFSRRRRGSQPVGQARRRTRLGLERLDARCLLSAGYQQLDLVGYQPGMARYTDPNLNGWGLDFAPNGPFCVANVSTGVATFYDQQGNTVMSPVIIPAAAVDPPGTPGSPTGVVYNPSSDFVISENGKSAPAEFIFDTLDGLICGWNPTVDPTHAIVVVDNSTEAPFAASYTGLAMARNSHGQNVLYAGDSGTGPTTSNNRIDMFDGSFHSIGSFTDPNEVSQYPGDTVFQVENVNNKLFVTYTGFTAPFGGVVDVFDTDGNLLTPNHFAANDPGQGPLNGPWGIVQAPAHFGAFSNDLLIGNVEGAGNINAFDPATGAFLGPLTHPDGTPIAIPGLWDLAFGGGKPINGKPDELYFTAGFTAEDPAGNGLFGMIDTRPVTVVNNQDSGVGSLRDAVTTASGDDTIAFDPSLAGQTITLTSGELAIDKNLDIEGPGASRLSVSGDDSSRVFDISGGVTVTIAGLTIADGFVQSDSGGGAILDRDSSLSLAHDVLCHNQAVGLGGSSAYVQGGAVNALAGTTLTVADCRFIENQVIGGPGGEGVGGGAVGIFGSASVTGSTFMSNLARAGDGGVAPVNAFFTGDTVGGALVNMFGTITVDRSTFTGNLAIAGNGGSGGSGAYFLDDAIGGGLMDCGGIMTVTNSMIDHNLALGGNGVTGGTGLGFIGDANGGGFAGYGVIAFANSTFDRNTAQSGSGNTGSDGGVDASAAYGGAICTDGGGLLGFSDSFTASNVTMTNNRAIGGSGNAAGGDPAGVLVGSATGGGFAFFDGGTSTATISGSTIEGNQAIGGAGEAGGDGADGRGGGLATYLGGILVVSNSTLERNQAVGGAGASGGNGGNGLGGGIYNDGSTALGVSSLTVVGSTITHNEAVAGAGGAGGSAGLGEGGGLYLAPGGIVCLDAFTQGHTKKNKATTGGDDIFGTYTTC